MAFDLHQYQSLRETAGLLDLSGRGKLEVSGQDRVSFLHNILTQDIEAVKTGGTAYAALLSATGKILADMNVFAFEDSLVLDAEAGLEKKLAGLLDKFLITEDVSFRDITADSLHLAIEGPKASLFTKELRMPVFEMARGMTGKKSFHILAAKRDGEILKNELQKRGAELAGPETVETARVEWGWLRYGIDIGEDVSLPETGLEDFAASETKGCYPGQEVVARTKTYKGWKRKFTGLLLPAENVPGTIVYSGDKEAGKITSSCFSPALKKNIALALVDYASLQQGGLTVRASGIAAPAKAVPLPFL